jgi:hypothetical protein
MMTKETINISYKNYELDFDLQARNKVKYANYLERQIKDREMQKKLEKERRRIEELEEERRIIKEREYLNRIEQLEIKRRKEEAEKYKLDNQRIMNSYMVLSKPKSNKEELILPQVSKAPTFDSTKVSFNLDILACI